MPVTIRTTSDTTGLENYLKALKATPQMVQETVEKDVYPEAQKLVAEFAVYPPPIAPGVFKANATPRQFRFVMAKIRRGEWSGRTGKLGRAWRTRFFRVFGEGARILIENTSPYARYVIGINQQKFHTITGWLRLQDQVGRVQAKMVAVFVAGFRKRFNSRVKR